MLRLRRRCCCCSCALRLDSYLRFPDWRCRCGGGGGCWPRPPPSSCRLRRGRRGLGEPAAAEDIGGRRAERRGHLPCAMCIPLAALLALGLGSRPKGQRGLRASSVLAALCWLAAASRGSCQRSDNRCVIANAATCSSCLAVGPECAWCAQEDFMAGTMQKARCDTVLWLIKRGCRADFIESPKVDVAVPAGKTNIQVTPEEVSVQLRPGSEASFMLKVHSLEKYPVDLYFLVDVSASMHKNIEKLNSVGSDLSQRMEGISTDLRLGFGSYVDKTVSPYISIHPGRIHNQCSDYDLDCMPPHGYIHVLSLTDKIGEFRSAISKQKISGNIDTPEGGFDAMLQVAVCQHHIGWRKEAKRVLLLMTDQTSHLALDSKLAGIVIPNDGNCHLKDNVYVRATSMEHPTLGQLSEKLIDNNINVIFAVQGSQFNWYKDLLPLLPGTTARQIESQEKNISDLVVEAYEKLLSEVKIHVANSVQDINVKVTAICPDGSKRSGLEGCKNVKSTSEVLFNISIALKGCSTNNEINYVILKPLGFNESTRVNIHKMCDCRCRDSIKPKRICVAEMTHEAEVSYCEGNTCSSNDKRSSEKCRMQKDHLICNGRGDCVGGKCVCHKSKFGIVYGEHCEKDDFSCPYHLGNLCAGNGECEAGKCRCFSGWEGNCCQCPTSLQKHCMNSDGQICSGRGTCVCGRCKCTDPSSFGRLCEYCSPCRTACSDKWNCVSCHHSNSSQIIVDQCKTSCSYKLHYADKSSGCISDDPNFFRIFFIIFTVTFLIGLLNVLIVRQVILQWSNNKIKSSADYRVSTAKKDKVFLPTVCTKTVTYRRDKPEEICISKSQVNETFKCNS